MLSVMHLNAPSGPPIAEDRSRCVAVSSFEACADVKALASNAADSEAGRCLRIVCLDSDLGPVELDGGVLGVRLRPDALGPVGEEWSTVVFLCVRQIFVWKTACNASVTDEGRKTE